MDKWYLKLSDPKPLSAQSVQYIDSIKPHDDKKKWDYQCNAMKAYKKELLSNMLKNQSDRCVYCGLSLTRTMVDREHFAPKDQHPLFTFEPLNLIASCAYCNQRMKGRADIVVTFNENYAECNFSIIHPYIEEPDDFFYFDEEDDAEEPGYNILFKLRNPTDKRAIATMEMFDLSSINLAAKRAGYIQEKKQLKRLQKKSLVSDVLNETR
jgi:uncharacterized protein (TIGR02646 family)